MLNRISDKERKHLAWVKEQPCVVCGEPGPSDAHHVEQHKQYLCIPLCKDCHTGSRNGIHGQRIMWNIKKMTELDALNEVVRRLASTK